MKFEGTSAIVTGGGSGLGQATAEFLASKGAKVAVLDINEESAKSVAEKIGGIAIACDISDEQSAIDAFAKVAEAHGTARILANVAGIGTASRIVGREGAMPLGKFAKVINVNLIGTFNMMRLGATEMSKLEPLEDGERGVIVNTASVAAYEGQLGQSAYSASKGGIIAMTLPAAREFGQFGIRVCAICPGFFSTPLVNELPDEVKDGLVKSIMFPKRLGHPAEFAELVGHICTNLSINGEVIRLDGGLRLPPR
jgi:NAD(P)-dependent dehydrogenase (short-subunit alcohol dehydrogenase family)